MPKIGSQRIATGEFPLTTTTKPQTMTRNELEKASKMT